MKTRGGWTTRSSIMFTARGRAEEERAADAVHHDVARHHLAAIGGPPVLVVGHDHRATSLAPPWTSIASAMRCMNRNEPSSTPTPIPVEQIEEHREQEGREQHHRVGERGAQQQAELGLVRHVPGDDDQHAGERGQRDVGDERHRDEDEDQQVKRMHHAGDRAARAGADIGRGARDRAGHRHAAAWPQPRHCRRLARPVRCSSDGAVPTCRRRPRPRAATRSRRELRWRPRRAAPPGFSRC